MNILLWVLQVLLALFFTMGAVQQLFNFEKIAKMYVVYRALPRMFWTLYGIVTLLGALGLVLTKVGPLVTPVAALVLTGQGLLFAALYAKFAGFKPSLASWALWTLLPCLFAAFIAYGRFVITP